MRWVLHVNSPALTFTLPPPHPGVFITPSTDGVRRSSRSTFGAQLEDTKQPRAFMRSPIHITQSTSSTASFQSQLSHPNGSNPGDEHVWIRVNPSCMATDEISGIVKLSFSPSGS